MYVIKLLSILKNFETELFGDMHICV